MATVARTKQDVDNMTRQERLWDSLNHAYGQQREASDRSFDRAYSQADRQALGRGMQRSSYNAQNLAGIANQKIKAQNDIWNNQIADYENRLGALESEEAEADRWERQFAAGREDAAWNKEFQQKQADTANQQWQMNFDAGRADAAWQQGMSERQYADSRADTAWNKNFQQAQADRSADQWERQFAQGNDDTDRQLAASYVASIVAQGGTPSDELLARAGLSRADAEAMRKGATGGSGGGPGPSNPGTDTPPDTNPDNLLDDVDLNNTGTLSDRLKGISGFLTRNGGVTATPGITAGGPYTTPSRAALVDNNNGNPNRYHSSPYGTTPISPIDDEFVSEFSVTEREETPLKKATNGAGGKIKSTTTKVK